LTLSVAVFEAVIQVKSMYMIKSRSNKQPGLPCAYCGWI